MTKRSSQMTVSPLVTFSQSSFPTLVVGNFNIHHPVPDPSAPILQMNTLLSVHTFLGRPSWALAYSTSLAVIVAFPLAARGTCLFLIFPLPLLSCSSSVRLGTPPSPPQVQTTSPSRSCFHTYLPLLPLAQPSGLWPMGLLLNHYSKTSLSSPLLLSPPGSHLRPGLTDTLQPSPLFSPPILPPSTPYIARNHGGLPFCPSTGKNSTPLQESLAFPTLRLIARVLTSPRKTTSKLLRPPRQLTGSPCSPPPPRGPYGPSRSYPCENSPSAVPLSPTLQQKYNLRLMRRRCVLRSATSFLRPVRPERPELRCNLLSVLSCPATLRCIPTRLHPTSTSGWRQMSPCLIPGTSLTHLSNPSWGYRKLHQFHPYVG